MDLKKFVSTNVRMVHLAILFLILVLEHALLITIILIFLWMDISLMATIAMKLVPQDGRTSLKELVFPLVHLVTTKII